MPILIPGDVDAEHARQRSRRRRTVMPAIQVGRGTHLSAVQRLHPQAALEESGRPLDLAIEATDSSRSGSPAAASATASAPSPRESRFGRPRCRLQPGPVGEQVQLVWRDGALELRLTGRALNVAAEESG
jgi:hypothetical protein